MAAVAPIRYRFAGFELEPLERRLLAQGEVQHVSRRTFDLLVMLVERHGHLVTKDEMLTQIWGRMIVGENALQGHISTLRKVLGPETIATVSGKGYRFTLQVVASAAAKVSAPAVPRHNLPHPLTRFIGREEVLDELTQLSAKSRLLTLTGSGGCGKTRLAIEFVRNRAPSYPEGAWLVELAALDSPMLLAPTLAGVLGVTEKQGVAWIDSLAEHLEPRATLLLLDNAEHLVDACAHLAETLLKRCERLAMVVTSRERLGVTGELTYRVPSLTVPDENDMSPDAVAACESTRLFLDRVQLHQPRFELNAGNAAAVGSICRQLDGIALAMELAAARVRKIPVDELARRLDQRFELLSEGSRTALPRQRTLHALVEWSYDLLDHNEKAVLRAVSAFAGGWTLEAAQRVLLAGASGGPDPEGLLHSLVEKSLISREDRHATPRYTVLETVRQFAAERVREAAEQAALEERHLGFFLELAEGAQARQSAVDAPAWLDRLEVERDNLRSALASSMAAQAGDARLRLVCALAWFWVTRGYLTEGRRWIAAALEKEGEPGDATIRSAALREASRLAIRQADYAVAREHAEAALSLALQSGDAHAIASAWSALGAAALSQLDLDHARECYRRALDLHRQAGNERELAVILCTLGQVEQSRHDFVAAESFLVQSVDLLRAHGDSRLPYALLSLGGVVHSRLELERARALYEEALVGWRKTGHRDGIAKTTSSLAQLAHDTGDFERLRPLLREALAIQVDVGNERDAAQTMATIAELIVARKDPSIAAQLWGHQHGLIERLGLPAQDYRERPPLLKAMQNAREAMGQGAFQAAWDRGQAMDFDVALALAVKVCG